MQILEWVLTSTSSGSAQNPAFAAIALPSAHLPWLECRSWLALVYCPGIEILFYPYLEKGEEWDL